MNEVEMARLAAGILNVSNLSETNKSLANDILNRALKELDKKTQAAALESSGIIT
jgi:hypothetical protein